MFWWKVVAAADKRAISDLDIAREQAIVRDDDAVRDAAVVADVHAGHQKIVVADRWSRCLRSCRGESCNARGCTLRVADLDRALRLRFEPEILRRSADDRPMADTVLRANPNRAFEDHMRLDDRACADDDVRADDREGTDLDVVGNDCAGGDNR